MLYPKQHKRQTAGAPEPDKILRLDWISLEVWWVGTDEVPLLSKPGEKPCPAWEPPHPGPVTEFMGLSTKLKHEPLVSILLRISRR